MIDKSIEYKSIIMRCDKVNSDAYKTSDSDIIMEYYVNGMEYIWIDIQKAVGEFYRYTDKEILSYFEEKFMVYIDQLKQRCLFLKDIHSGKYIGTCCAWFDKKEDKIIPVLHWLAVKDEFANNGYARILITEIIKIFQNMNPNESIYLHTQPCSYRAIKLYNDFGFCIAQKDIYGTAVNDCDEAMKLLKIYLEQKVYEKLQRTLVP